MKYLNLFFHIYQPPFQDATVIQKIVDECYLPLTRQIAAFRDLKFTLNINFSLTEHLDHIAPEVLRNIREANKNGQLELTESGAYHPIFPLIPQAEVETQLRLNRAGNQRLLVPAFAPHGIFPPEMAFEPRLATVFKRLGDYKWTIADDFGLDHYGIPTPYNKIYNCEGIAVFLRSNLWSNKFARYQPGQWRSGKEFVQELITGMNQWMGKDDGYLIIALDGETFGHHHPSLGETFLKEMFQALQDKKEELQLDHLSDIYKRFDHVPQFIPPSSWSMDEKNIQDRDYFTLWKSPGNPIHRLQWDFTYYVLDQVGTLADESLHDEMSKTLFSCQYWWASFWKFSPAMIYQGAFNMMRLLQRIGGKLGYDHIEEGEKIFRELVIEVEKRDLRGTTHA